MIALPEFTTEEICAKMLSLKRKILSLLFSIKVEVYRCIQVSVQLVAVHNYYYRLEIVSANK